MKKNEAMPWDIFGITKREYEAIESDANSEGLIICTNCGFGGMYKKTCRQPDGKFMCPCCGRYFELKEE